MSTAPWLVTGAGGQVGSRVVERLRAAGAEVVATTHAQLDIADAEQVAAFVAESRPPVVINTAAYTAVDAAEQDEPGADRVNHLGVQRLAAALARTGGRLVHVSTDYVFAGTGFAGTGNRPYEPDDPVAPQGAYGRTKLAGERAALAALPGRCSVVRTAWVYGGPGANFVDTMLRLERERETVDVVADQIGSPTWAGDLAGALIELGAVGGPGPGPAVLHYANAGQASWYELACEVFRLAGADPARVRPVPTSAVPRPAPRPAWSVLSTAAWTRAGLPPPRPWRAALAEAIDSRQTGTGVSSA